MAISDSTPVQIGPLRTSVQQIEFLCCLLSSYLFSWIYYRRLLRSKWHKIKQAYLAGVSHLYVLVCFSKPIMLNIYIPVLVTYVMTKKLRDRRWMPVGVFAFVLAHLSLAHLHRQFFELDLGKHVIDQTAPLMILAIKLTSYAYDISDAYFAAVWDRPRRSARTRRSSSIQSPVAKAAAPGTPGGPDPNLQDEAYRERQLISLQKPATFLEFLGFTFLFPGFLCGPVISFYEYRSFVDGTYFEGVDTAKGALKGRKSRALHQFLVAMAFLLLYAGFKDTITIKASMTAEHLAKPVWYRMLYLHAANLVWRCKYYFAWLAAEGSYVMLGIGLRRNSQHGGKPRWDRCENVNLKRIELASNFKQVVSEWNVSTNSWLYAYVYRRVADWLYPGYRPGFLANLATYVISAFWHVQHRHAALLFTECRASIPGTMCCLCRPPSTPM